MFDVDDSSGSALSFLPRRFLKLNIGGCRRSLLGVLFYFILCVK